MPRRACSRELRDFAWRRCQHANCAPSLRGEMGETISRRHPPPWWIQHKVLSMRKKHPTNPPPALWALAPSLVPSGLVHAGAHSAELDARAAMALRPKGESCDLDRSPQPGSGALEVRRVTAARGSSLNAARIVHIYDFGSCIFSAPIKSTVFKVLSASGPRGPRDATAYTIPQC